MKLYKYVEHVKVKRWHALVVLILEKLGCPKTCTNKIQRLPLVRAHVSVFRVRKPIRRQLLYRTNAMEVSRFAEK